MLMAWHANCFHPGMTSFRALAVDLDGTLAPPGAAPSPALLDALADARRAGLRVVLATERGHEELLERFPEVDQLFDAVVAENGAVLALDGTCRLLASPVGVEVDHALRTAHVPFSRGRAIVTTDARHGATALEIVRRLGLDHHLAHDRDALVIGPARASKGAGLLRALAELRRSPRDCWAVGDAETDHALFDVCEVGVAVRGAIHALARRADLVLDEPAGEGVIRLLRAWLRGERPRTRNGGRCVDVGLYPDGGVARIPVSSGTMLVHGGKGTGKSWLAGLLAERLCERGYVVCAVDPEGEHRRLGDLPGVLTVGGGEALPPVGLVARLLATQLASVVVDLSLEPAETRETYARDLLAALYAQRAATGLPHWIVVDEAHVALHAGLEGEERLDRVPPGTCLVTWRPDWLARPLAEGHDVVLEALGANLVELRVPGAAPRVFRPGDRAPRLLRGRGAGADAPAEHHFWFRTASGRTGRSVGTLKAFERELGHASDAVLLHHLAAGDFSTWILEVFRDVELADRVREVELEHAAEPERARMALQELLARRYPVEREALPLAPRSAA